MQPLPGGVDVAHLAALGLGNKPSTLMSSNWVKPRMAIERGAHAVAHA